MIEKYKVASSRRTDGFISRKFLMPLIALAIVSVGALWIASLLNDEEEKVLQEKYYTAKKADFLVTVKLTGTLVATDVVTLKSELEGETTIQSIVDEGTEVKGNTIYETKAGDTIKSIADKQKKNSLSIQLLNKELDLDWDNLPVGQEIEIPGDLLVELDPLRLRERINTQDIAVQRAENTLNRAKGDLATLKLSTALAMKVAENSLQNADMDQEKTQNSTVKNYVQNLEGMIANFEKDVTLAEKNLKAYTKLKELGFVSEVEVLREESSKAKTLHNIKMAKVDLDAYRKYDRVSLLSLKQLAVDEASVNIEKTKVKNKADLSDANSTVYTAEKTLELEKEKLEDLREQMANTKIYAPQSGTVVYWSEHRYGRGEPIINGAQVHRGRNLIKLPKSKSLKVEISVPQAKRSQLKKDMRAWVQVEDITLPGTLSLLGTNVDNNQRGHSDKSYFKGEISLDESNGLPSDVAEGMKVTVEIQVINLVGENQRVRVPNQCVTTRMITEDHSQRGCWVLAPKTEKHEWRPITIEYSDETFIAIKEESDPDLGLREGELVHLSPLSEARNLNLEEGVVNKGVLDLKRNISTPEKEKSASSDKRNDKEKDSVAGGV
ncbi:HlyD family efflux transporter periplasmic adaptor subunit [Opitutales bacterium]|jgi:multidrug efflux pump subunit AcrA (membrane-fusion protein)|nr:HlyD family efflux transporter periplasmic adaptor subunit [Opitutales bacterium]